LRDAAEKLAEEGARVATAGGLVATPEISEATDKGAAHTILAAADRHDAGAIVLGARGLSKFQSFLLGSVSNGVVQNARRPVLIVPPIGQSAATGGQVLEDASMGQEPAVDA
jgi:nucleotide-binding universal stress UspA family protein